MPDVCCWYVIDGYLSLPDELCPGLPRHTAQQLLHRVEKLALAGKTGRREGEKREGVRKGGGVRSRVRAGVEQG